MDMSSVVALIGRADASGLAVGVSVDAEVVFRCRGEVAGEPVGPHSLMYGASLTKQVIGVILARAVLDDTIGFGDHIRTWMPELPTWMDPVQLCHLLHHTSGLPEVTSADHEVAAANVIVVERLQGLPGPGGAAPGRELAYCNTGYILLAEAIARAVGRPIQDIAASQLFEPLGMSDTRLGGPSPRVPGHLDAPGTIGDGGLWTSVADMLAWLTALNRHTFGAELMRTVETPGRLADGTSIDYAWGVRVTSAATGRTITHGGTWGSWLSKTVRQPEQRIAVAVLSSGGTEEPISTLGTDLATTLASARPI